MSDDIRVTISVLNDLEAIKRLLVLQLISSGVRCVDVALCLGIREKEVRRWLPKTWDVVRNSRRKAVA